jgi:YHS domain-containing protein
MQNQMRPTIGRPKSRNPVCARTIGREGAPMPNQKDPVCKMDVDPARAAAQSSYKGVTYYFCCVGCKRSFDREPEKYLAT